MKLLTLILFILFSINCFTQQWFRFGGDTIHKASGCPNACAVPYDFYADGDTLYMVGEFQWANGLELFGTAKWDGHQWLAMPPFSYGDNAKCVIKYKNKMFIGGNTAFEIDGVPDTQYLAYWDGNNWHGVQYTLHSHIWDMIIYHDTLFIGNNNGKCIAAYDGTEWIDVGDMNSDWTWSLAVFNDELYAGGYFGFRKKTGPTTWEEAYGNTNGWIDDMIVDTINNFLYLGGSFDHVGYDYLPSQAAAMWDGYKWNSLGWEISCDVSNQGMAIYRGDLYVGFCDDTLYSSQVPINYIARWDGNQWHPLGQGCSATVSSLAVYKDTLIVGGIFQFVDDTIETWSLAKWFMPDTGCGYLKPIMYALEKPVVYGMQSYTVQDTFYIHGDMAEVQFYNNNAYVDSWHWDFGDGGIDTIREPKYFYTDTGTFNVSITITDGACIKTVTKTITIKNVTDVNEISMQETGFKLYPNPTSNTLFIEITDKKLLGKEIQIIDIKGNIVKNIAIYSQFNRESAKLQTDISALQKGVYFVKIGGKTERFVKE